MTKLLALLSCVSISVGFQLIPEKFNKRHAIAMFLMLSPAALISGHIADQINNT